MYLVETYLVGRALQITSCVRLCILYVNRSLNVVISSLSPRPPSSNLGETFVIQGKARFAAWFLRKRVTSDCCIGVKALYSSACKNGMVLTTFSVFFYQLISSLGIVFVEAFSRM